MFSYTGIASNMTSKDSVIGGRGAHAHTMPKEFNDQMVAEGKSIYVFSDLTTAAGSVSQIINKKT